MGLTLTAAFFVLLEAWKRKNQGPPIVDKTEKVEDSREIWLDLLKVVSAFFIVMIHAVGSGYQKTFGTGVWRAFLILNVLPRFAVPVFMMVSGALMLGKEISIKKAVRKAGKTAFLLVVWNLFYLFLRCALWGEMDNLWQQIFAIPVKRQFSGHLWYIYFLVWMYLFAPVLGSLYRALSRNKRFYLVCITLLVPGVLDLYNNWFSFGGQTLLASYQLYMVPSYVGLMVLGRLIYDEFSKVRYAGLVGMCMSIIGFGGTVLLTECYCKLEGKASDLLISENKLLIVLFSTGIFLLAASQSARLVQMPKKGKCLVVFLSKRALGIYLFHAMVIWLLPTFRFAEHTFTCSSSAMEALLCIILYYVISVYCVSAMSKIPLIREFVM